MQRPHGELMDESVLISKTEKYLNKIQNEIINIEDMSDFEGFTSVYFNLTNHLEKLLEIKESMDIKGYTAPYRSLSKYGSNVTGEIAFEEISEVRRHSQYFRTNATAKKNILDRVKSAIDAHKIAIGNLEEYGLIECKSCLKLYKSSVFKEMGEKCICGSSKFDLKLNKKGVWRLEIIPHLPLSGNYMVLISQLSKWGRESFKNVSKILKQEKIGSVKTVSVVIRVKEKNRWVRKRVSLESEYTDSYEEEIRKQFGKNVRIELLQFHRIKPTIINDKHARAALAIGYVKYSENIIDKCRNILLKENLKDLDGWNQYQKVLNDIKLQTPEFIEDEDLEEWRNHELEEKLKKFKLMDKYGELNKNLKRDQKTAEIIDKKIFSKIASTLILWDIFKFYLTTSNDRRKRYGGPFPYLRSDIDRKQRRIFQYLDEKIVTLLKEYENEQIVSLNNMDLILNEKFNLERKIKGSNIKINYVALGAALIYSNSDLNIDEVANAFNVSQKDVSKEIKNIKNIKKPKSKKSEKFLEMIKND
ncbi:MAG: DUF530 domain-containing protein [Methanobrevibacter sp.]|nr:DUF530 domain-containing protein [Methanobrevibacter sp.]